MPPFPTQPSGGYPGSQHGGQHSPYPPAAPPPGPPPSHGGPQPHTQSSAPAPPVGGAAAIPNSGSYEGIQYNIAHRDSNSLLSVRISPGHELKAKPGSMVAMDPTVKIQGKVSLTVSLAVSNHMLMYIADEI